MAYSFIFIDDEELIRENMKYMADWESLGFSLEETFSNSQEALEYLEDNEVDLVMTDIVLKNESGLDLAKNVSKLYPQILTVIISAHRDFEFAKTAIDCGVFAYLTKPTLCEDISSLFKKAKKEIDKIKSMDSVSSFLYSEVTFHSLIEKAIVYINNNFQENITRNDVANHLDINPQYFSKYFKKYTGKKFVDYLNEVRINYAMHLLKNTNLKIYEICDMCCYKNKHYFLSLFKQYTNLTPNKYRSQFMEQRGEDLG